jgi:hypothetical protein
MIRPIHESFITDPTRFWHLQIVPGREYLVRKGGLDFFMEKCLKVE